MTAIAWPAILHLSGDHELIYIASQSQWHADASLHVCHFVPGDRLIDSQGAIYNLNQRDAEGVLPQASNQSASLEDVITLAQAHLSEQGSCCVTKFFASSIGEAIAIAFPDEQ